MMQSIQNEYRQRLGRLRRRLGESGASALVVTHSPNIFYLSGFLGSAGILAVEADRTTLLTDGRYMTQSREQARGTGIRVQIPQAPILRAAGEFLAAGKGRSRRVAAFDPDHLTVAAKGELARAAGRAVSWVAAHGWVEELRIIKSPAELAKIRAAARLISEVCGQVIQMIRPGVTEIDLAAEADYRMRKLGAEGPSFETIVASGWRAALPHARPTTKRLRRNEFVVLDLGAILAGYCSDMTRTVYVGSASKRLKGWYRAVLEAQQAARDAVAVGATTGRPDAAARAVLDGYGLGGYFIHSTGHGLGLEVHEAPRLAKGQKGQFEPRMVVTIEPGIYVEGVGGIRIEDDVAVYEGKTETLTTTPREFLEI
jgi:Xaa-Pro aminopeptidase